VGFTAIISAVYLFPRFVDLPTPLQLILQTSTLLGGSVLGTAVVIQLYPLFLMHEYRTALRVFVVNGVVATIVGTLLFSYEAMRARLRESLRILEEVRLKESELRTQAARAQLAALQARIKPHFFFNTLNTISSLVADDPDRAEDTIALLADLFRYTLKTTGARLVPFRDEVEFVEKYLRIEKARFGERLRTAFDIGPECGDALVPGLILQPIVENAVAHGIAPRAAGGAVTVRARIRDEALEVEVADDGPGPAPAEKLFQDGHGLANVRDRIATLYGHRGGLGVGLRDGGGTKVTMLMPQQPPWTAAENTAAVTSATGAAGSVGSGSPAGA
jgi:two-component system sensor histidine kinase AlgZ